MMQWPELARVLNIRILSKGKQSEQVRHAWTKRGAQTRANAETPEGVRTTIHIVA